MTTDLQPSDEISLRVDFDGVTAVSDADVGELVALVNDWIKTGQYGGLCIVDAPIAASRIDVGAMQGHWGSACTWQLSCRLVDSRSFRVLRNALVAYGHIVSPLRSVVVAPLTDDAGAALHPLSLADHPAIPPGYPPAARLLDFVLHRPARHKTGASRRALIRFGEPVTAETGSLLEALLDSWAMVAFCGFPLSELELETGRCAIFNTDVDQTDDREWVITIDDFGGAEAAWNPVLNLCATLSATRQRIVSVAIE